MKPLRKPFPIMSLIVLFLVSCTGQPKGKQDLLQTNYNEEDNPFIGVWDAVERAIEYGAKLIIYEDSTFRYHYGACMLDGFSNGYWEIQDSIIMLTSIDSDSCLFVEKFGYEATLFMDSVQQTTIHNCKPKNHETSYVTFDEVMFYRKGDSLIFIITDDIGLPELKRDFVKYNQAVEIQ